MSVNEMYHVGIVVPDLEAGCARFTELLGTIWGPVVDREVELRDGDGNDFVERHKVCYSTKAPYIELMQELPGSSWVCNEHSNIHHIGFWSDGLADDSLALSASACPLEMAGRSGDSVPVGYTNHVDPLGVRIEYVDVAQRAMLEAFLTGDLSIS
jgi:hypothetical protein